MVTEMAACICWSLMWVVKRFDGSAEMLMVS